MKKLIIIISITLTFALSSCFPITQAERVYEDIAEWYVKNSTQSNIFVKSSGKTEFYNVLVPGDSLALIYVKFETGSERVNFEYLYRIDPREDYIEVATWDKVVVKTWRESEKNDAGRQLFNEQYWRFRKDKPLNNTYFMWTFDILPEDMSQ